MIEEAVKAGKEKPGTITSKSVSFKTSCLERNSSICISFVGYSPLFKIVETFFPTETHSELVSVYKIMAFGVYSVDIAFSDKRRREGIIRESLNKKYFTKLSFF